MKYYETQAFAVKLMLNNLIQMDKELGTESPQTIADLRDAITTLNALALIGESTILRAQKLEAVAREIVNMIFENRGTIYDDEAVELKEKLQKILGEWEPGDPDMNGPNQAERDEQHFGYQNLK